MKNANWTTMQPSEKTGVAQLQFVDKMTVGSYKNQGPDKKKKYSLFPIFGFTCLINKLKIDVITNPPQKKNHCSFH